MLLARAIAAIRAFRPRHFSVLGHVQRSAGVSYSELARRAGVTVQSMQATASLLKGLGLVVQTSPGGRGRVARLELSPAGQQSLVQAQAAVADLEVDIMAAVHPADKAQLDATLALIATSLMGRSGPDD